MGHIRSRSSSFKAPFTDVIIKEALTLKERLWILPYDIIIIIIVGNSIMIIIVIVS